MAENFDVIVIGAGHAGVEASLVCARLGLNTAIVTTNLGRISHMSCNPSIGGLAKGHMVRELDILGGEMGLAADNSCIQFKRLNSRKGPAVRGSRSQCDKDLYSQYMSNVLRSQPGLVVFGGEVKKLILVGDICTGVELGDGSKMKSNTVIITTGTFMNGMMHVGLEKSQGGRVGDNSTSGLSQQLAGEGFEVKRLKTGTPARLAAESIDWSKTEPQEGDKRFWPFSLRSQGIQRLPQVKCFISRTNELTHEIIRKNLHRSPMYSGQIEGLGPRYCPSIEDKVTRFADRKGHQTFLEPEGLSTNSIYLQGISTSLPEDTQNEFLKTIPGLENVKVIRYGYAVEYDFILPTQIKHSLETKQIRNLFLAGQINGTSGYEEAAVQGFIAGINAFRKIRELEPFVLRRDEAYIGVLIDDLVTKGTLEPYRMFTSRAEYRLVLREDNTVDRLAKRAEELGVVGLDQLEIYSKLIMQRDIVLNSLRSTKLYPNEETQKKLRSIPTAVLQKPINCEELLRRSEISFDQLASLGWSSHDDPEDILEPVEIQIKYAGYISRQGELIKQAERLERLTIPVDIRYGDIRGLSLEEVEKLDVRRPITLGQAKRISGVNPSAIQAILIHLKGRQKLKDMSF